MAGTDRTRKTRGAGHGSAFDAQRPPSREISTSVCIADCLPCADVRFVERGMDSPAGRIYLMKLARREAAINSQWWGTSIHAWGAWRV